MSMHYSGMCLSLLMPQLICVFTSWQGILSQAACVSSRHADGNPKSVWGATVCLLNLKIELGCNHELK